MQAILRFLAGDQRGFEKLIGSLRVSEEIEQAGIDLGKIESNSEAPRK